MTQIRVPFKEHFDMGGGTVSVASWNTVKKHLNNIFNVKDNEYISGLIIDENGIRAYFEIK